MARSSVTLLVLLSSGVAACGCMPHQAEYLTERAVLARADLQSNGILAFSVQNETRLEIEVDFVHEQSQRKYRVDFSPSFRRVEFVRPWRLEAVELVSDSVAMYQLPAGTYRPVYILPREDGRQTSPKAKGPSFEIVAGKITSVGRLVIRAESYLIILYENLRIEPTPGSIDSDIRAVQDPGIRDREIVAAQLSVQTD